MNIFLILSTCFIVVLSSPGRARAEKPEEFYREGLEHFKQGRDAEAVRAFRRAADADYVAATGFLGRCAERRFGSCPITPSLKTQRVPDHEMETPSTILRAEHGCIAFAQCECNG